MKIIRRFIGGMIAGLVMAAATGQAAAPAMAASTVYVNDSTGNDGAVNCPITPYTTIQAGIDQATSIGAKTVIVCQGDLYTSGGSVSLVPGGLTVKALGDVVVKPAGPYSGALFQASQSNKINFQGFIIDGQATVTSATAFHFFDSSGSITKNTVRRWRSSTPYAPPAGTNFGVQIQNTTSLSVKVDHNTLSDMSNIGIKIVSPGGVTVSHNLIQTYTEWLGGSPYRVTYNVTGILADYTNGAKILNNTIITDQNLANTGIPISRAIFLSNASSNQIKNNTISNYYHGIQFIANCPGSSSSNTISGNKMYETKTGVSIGSWGGCATDVYQNNKITGNKIYTNSSVIGFGVIVVPTGAEVVSGNQVKGNTIAGYGASALNVSGGNTNSGNKTPVVPPPGI